MLRNLTIVLSLLFALGPIGHSHAKEPQTEIAKNPKRKKKRRQRQIESLPIIDDLQISGKTLSGKQVDLADYRGKYVLVDFWGTWCSPCISELPALKLTYETLHEHGFEVVGVAADDRKSLKRFTENTMPLPWRNIVDGEMKIAERIGVEAFPTTLLVDKEGKHIKSDVFGVELFDELIIGMELEPGEFAKARDRIVKLTGHSSIASTDTESDSETALSIGFGSADSDSDGSVSRDELQVYLDARLKENSLPHARVFRRLDQDKDGGISDTEFEKRHDVIRRFMGERYQAKSNADEPDDPGANYVPFRGLNQPLDDKAIFGAIYNRYYDLTKQKWPYVDLQSIPNSSGGSPPLIDKHNESSVQDLVRSTLILAGGGRQFFTAGAVVISSDGLAVTAFHVAEAMKDSNLLAMTADGKCHRVTELLAGDANRDIALIRVEGDGFHPAKIATAIPAMGSDLVMMHHSENRFYTYDRGYVMRHPKLGKHSWMEISADYAPGGSGCGIFNSNQELIGLVSIIQYGDGPSMAEGFPEGLQWDESEEDYADEDAILLVKHAVGVSSIHSLFTKGADAVGKGETKEQTREAIPAK